MDDHDAAYWAIRRDAGPLQPDEQATFDTWLKQDERREGALLRAEAALVLLDRGRALGVSVPEEDDNAQGVSRRAFVLSALAGTAAAASVGGFFLHDRGDAIETVVGEIRRAPLADGSVATINTASRLVVDMQPELRHVRLDSGEAWFEVAHDRTRPFVVAAGDVRVRAVGTAFSVRRHADGVDVLVTEGVVETWLADRADVRARIASGRRTFVADDTASIASVRADAEIERALAWRNGGLALDGDPLDYAVSELNRYNRHKIVVDDPVLGRMPIVGYFHTNQPEVFARSVAVLVGARVETDADETRLLLKSS